WRRNDTLARQYLPSFLARCRKAIIDGVPPFFDSMKSKPVAVPKPAQTRIIRAVASSTAIETGQSVKELEALLKAQTSKFQQLNPAPSAYAGIRPGLLQAPRPPGASWADNRAPNPAVSRPHIRFY